MHYDEYVALTNTLRQDGRLGDLVAPKYSKSLGHFVEIGYQLDLAAAYAKALKSDATSLEVFADTVFIPSDTEIILRDRFQTLRIFARKILVGTRDGDRADVALVHNSKLDLQPLVQFIADEIENELWVTVTGTKGTKDTEATTRRLEASLPGQPLRFQALSCDNTGLVAEVGKLPLKLLDLSTPLYQILSGQFDLAAGAFAPSFTSPEHCTLARSLLTWLVRWSAYPTPYLTRLFEEAEALQRLLPLWDDAGQAVYPIPARTPEVYLALAKSHQELADKYELDQNFEKTRDKFTEIAGKVVSAWMARDREDLRVTESEVKTAQDLVRGSRNATEAARKRVEDQHFEAKIESINFETELKKDRIRTIVKATFEMVVAVFQIGAGIATMKPAFGSVGGALSSVKGGIKGAATTKRTIMLLYLLPINIIKEVVSIDGKDKKALGKGLSSAGPGIAKLFKISSDLIKNIDKHYPTAAALGDMVSETTGVPDPVESKAIWDSFEVEAVNQLDSILLDQDASDKIKSAARTYKTNLQKFAILNRAFSEQQSLLAQRTRELGTLVLQKFAVEAKLATLQQLSGNLSNQDEVLVTLSLQRSARLRELRQAFFSAYCKYRAAYFYRHLAWPAKMPSAVVPSDATEMKEMLLDVDRALTSFKPLSGNYRAEELLFKRSADTQLFANLDADGEVHFDIKAADSFSEDGLVRVRQMRAWLVGPGNTISIVTELLSGAVLRDRLPNGGAVHFTGDPFFFSFEYKGEVIKYDPAIEGVLPPPFSGWTLKVKSPGLDLKTVDSIKVEMIGTSVRKPR
ncbi:hypothetical protein [Edaphobacter dinghuensis]|uniref:Uncharacterized protein n=1 Tax=Edaphobacter dinghuensis TaxID=1560005 RepID=A0A917H9K2_9BACT|nr:hypothetical protein [Edaphobacter dinghuensis]GGG71181.1 hypothetical protein GCM10011585_11730 [Edaphobacter dinghuensis]